MYDSAKQVVQNSNRQSPVILFAEKPGPEA